MSAHDDDCAIHDFLERRAPDRFDAFMQVVGRALHRMVPSLKRKLRRYGSVVDADEAIGAAIERALIYLRSQYLGHGAQLPVHPVVRALVRGLGGVHPPFRCSRTGQAGQARAPRTTWRRMEPAAASGTIESPTEALKKALDIEALTEALKPRQQFVVCADFGFHNEGPLDAAAIVRLASKVRLPSPEIRKMRRRAGGLWPAGAKPSARLSHAQIGQLLDVSERQVHNIKRDALDTLRAGAAGP